MPALCFRCFAAVVRVVVVVVVVGGDGFGGWRASRTGWLTAWVGVEPNVIWWRRWLQPAGRVAVRPGGYLAVMVMVGGFDNLSLLPPPPPSLLLTAVLLGCSSLLASFVSSRERARYA